MRDSTSTPEESVLGTYRELAPSPELRGSVRAFFSFTPGAACLPGHRAVMREVRFTRGESFCAPVFADGHASLVMELGATCHLGQGWTSGTAVRARVMGALRAVGDIAGSAHSEMIGVYLDAGSTAALLQVPPLELTDRVVNLEDI